MLLGDDMRIGALGKGAGIDPETIRYYERMGLLPAPERQANGYRAYGTAHLEQLACQPMTIPSWFVRSRGDARHFWPPVCTSFFCSGVYSERKRKNGLGYILPNPLFYLVERRRIELPTFALRTRRSPS